MLFKPTTTQHERDCTFLKGDDWSEKLDEVTLSLARKLADKPPATVAAGKRAFYQQMDMGLAKAYELAGGVISASFAHQEGRAGMEAFIEKRPPPKH